MGSGVEPTPKPQPRPQRLHVGIDLEIDLNQLRLELGATPESSMALRRWVRDQITQRLKSMPTVNNVLGARVYLDV